MPYGRIGCQILVVVIEASPKLYHVRSVWVHVDEKHEAGSVGTDEQLRSMHSPDLLSEPKGGKVHEIDLRWDEGWDGGKGWGRGGGEG